MQLVSQTNLETASHRKRIVHMLFMIIGNFFGSCKLRRLSDELREKSENS